MDRIQLLHGDCMELIANTPDKFYDLAIVDPPYGIGVNKMNMGGRRTIRPDERNWDDFAPSSKYFIELKRISKNQIIWGANHFISKMPYDAKCWIVWDKGETMLGRDFAEVELAYCSIDTPAKIFKNTPNQLDRIHPTQKPVKLYNYLLDRFATPNMHILDTHLGSGSSAIAAHYYGCKFTGIEIDADYYNAAVKRFNLVTSQQQMF